MSVYTKNNRFASYVITLIALFVLVLFTKDQIMLIQENNDLKETYTLELNNKKAKLAELNELKKELASSQANIEKFKVSLKEDELIDYIYSYIESTNDSSGVSIVKSLSISDSTDTEIGFKETNINLTIKVPNENKFKAIVEFLTSSDSKYNFYISSLTFPYGETEEGFNVWIPLKIFHR